ESYQSRWLPRTAFEESPAALAASLIAASRRAPFALHLNKGLSGAAPQAKARDRSTCINPAALDASALLIMSSAQHHVYPGIPGREPDLALARERSASIDAAMSIVRNATPGSGAYLNEADYFEPDWQRSFWGPNYRRLLSIKHKYDPTSLFQVHHGVGSDR
ncbi:MAG: BBE domain-containing protein, partial [Acidimicrobiales bacterium]